MITHPRHICTLAPYMQLVSALSAKYTAKVAFAPISKVHQKPLCHLTESEAPIEFLFLDRHYSSSVDKEIVIDESVRKNLDKFSIQTYNLNSKT